MDTLSTWKYSTAAAPAPLLTQEEKAVRATVNTAPVEKAVRAAVNTAPVEKAVRAAVTSAVNPLGGEEGSGANALAPDDTFDSVRGGARLILSYDAASNSFKGTVENTTNNVLTRVRVEVHLSNGTELGPTTPTDMAPGEVAAINLPATPASFTGWTAHAEVGAGGEGSESGGEHRSGNEHGSGEESGSEHDSGGERRGGG